MSQFEMLTRKVFVSKIVNVYEYIYDNEKKDYH